MKQFCYKWKLHEKEMQGKYKCESQEALREHVNKIGGELIEIVEEKEIVEETPPPAPVSEAPQAEPAPA